MNSHLPKKSRFYLLQWKQSPLEIQNQPFRCVFRKRCSENMQQFTGEHPCRNAISIKLQSKNIETALCHDLKVLTFFSHVEKRLHQKAKVNFKVITSKTVKQIIAIHLLSNISRKISCSVFLWKNDSLKGKFHSLLAVDWSVTGLRL